ncbi:MAG: hypothetical protein FWC72_02080 [Oscillospiraceae bacterium]|nr:hypothetical protein [Oscillospiraceae bacterium]
MRTKEYVAQVLQFVEASETVKRRLSEDLLEHINAAGGDEAIKRMGSPKDMAAELMDTLYADKTDVIRELVKAKAELRESAGYEYISKTRLFGLPLVHICMRGPMFWRRNQRNVAKGIIAIGDIAVGLVAIGGISAGLISLGGISLGLLALGGLALGGWALGGVAIGLLAWGAVAVGMYALGAVSVASHVAIGQVARGTVAIGENAEGLYTMAGDLATRQDIRALITQAYPNTWQVIIRLLSLFHR